MLSATSNSCYVGDPGSDRACRSGGRGITSLHPAGDHAQTARQGTTRRIRANAAPTRRDRRRAPAACREHRTEQLDGLRGLSGISRDVVVTEMSIEAECALDGARRRLRAADAFALRLHEQPRGERLLLVGPFEHEPDERLLAQSAQVRACRQRLILLQDLRRPLFIGDPRQARSDEMLARLAPRPAARARPVEVASLDPDLDAMRMSTFHRGCEPAPAHAHLGDGTAGEVLVAVLAVERAAEPPQLALRQ